MSGYTLKSKLVLNTLRGTTDSIAKFLESCIVQGRVNSERLLHHVDLGDPDNLEPHFVWKKKDSTY